MKEIKYIILGYIIALMTSCVLEPLDAGVGMLGTKFNPMYVICVDE